MLGSGSLGFGKEGFLDNYNGEKQKRSNHMNLKNHFHSFCWQNGSGTGSFSIEGDRVFVF